MRYMRCMPIAKMSEQTNPDFLNLISSEQIASLFDNDPGSDDIWSLLQNADDALGDALDDTLGDDPVTTSDLDPQIYDGDLHPFDISQLDEKQDTSSSRPSNKRGLDGDNPSSSPPSHLETVSDPSSAEHLEQELAEAEKLQAREIEALSLQDREQVYEDIHGVRRPPEETEAFLKDRLHRLNAELTMGLCDSRRKNHQSDSVQKPYRMAALLAPRLTCDVAFRIAMLRSTNWDVEKAAVKIVQYFHVKERLFGRERSLRPIVLSDLQDDARQSIEDGAYIVHDGNEGICHRPVVFNFAARWKTQTIISQAQAVFYLPHVAARSAQAQQYGVSVVVLAMKAHEHYFRDAIRMMQFNVLDNVPARTAGMHICISDDRFQDIISHALQVAPKDQRLRAKFHYGSVQACKNHLLTYGIRSTMIPDNEDTICGNATNHDTIQRCLQYDREVLDKYSEGKPDHCIDAPPNPNDVLLGRGRPLQKFPGNLEFSRLLQECKPSYDQASKPRKTEITRELVQKLRDAGVRFLMHDDSGDWWEEVPDAVARKRAAMSLRNMSRKREE